jgi:hypothetical protein
VDDQNDRAEYSREPTLEDLIQLCKRLNEAGAKYVVIGGFAVILNGFTRTTGDVDLLVDSSPENVARIKEALLYLPDQAVREIEPEEVAQYQVVRVADEIIVDLVHKACEVIYDHTRGHIAHYIVDEVRIPFLTPALLLKTKMTLRPKDAEDRFFLEQLLQDQRSEALPRNHDEVRLPLLVRMRRFLSNLLR